MRWDNRPGRTPQPGEMIIDAFVRARLLGLSLLTLEAHVVVGHEDGNRQVIRPRRVASETEYSGSRYAGLRHPGSRLREISPAPGHIVPAVVEGPGLTRAEQLLEQGEDTLARSRRRSP